MLIAIPPPTSCILVKTYTDDVEFKRPNHAFYVQ